MKDFLVLWHQKEGSTLKNLDHIPLTICQIQIMFDSEMYIWEKPQVYYCGDRWH